MKKLLFLSVLLSGCGMIDSAFNDINCLTLDLNCPWTKDIEKSNNELKRYLQKQINYNINQIKFLQDQINDLLNDLSTNSDAIDSLESIINTLQININQNTLDLLELESNHNVTKIVDPCGDGPGFDEILLRTNSGKLIASFSSNSSGANTRFVELVPGTYGTTDSTGCIFTVNTDFSITSNPVTVEY